jgi:hypothetical protein
VTSILNTSLLNIYCKRILRIGENILLTCEIYQNQKETLKVKGLILMTTQQQICGLSQMNNFQSFKLTLSNLSTL